MNKTTKEVAIYQNHYHIAQDNFKYDDFCIAEDIQIEKLEDPYLLIQTNNEQDKLFIYDHTKKLESEREFTKQNNLEQHRKAKKKANMTCVLQLNIPQSSKSQLKLMKHLGNNYILLKFSGQQAQIFKININQKEIIHEINMNFDFIGVIDQRTMLVERTLEEEQVKRHRRHMGLSSLPKIPYIYRWKTNKSKILSCLNYQNIDDVKKIVGTQICVRIKNIFYVIDYKDSSVIKTLKMPILNNQIDQFYLMINQSSQKHFAILSTDRQQQRYNYYGRQSLKSTLSMYKYGEQEQNQNLFQEVEFTFDYFDVMNIKFQEPNNFLFIGRKKILIVKLIEESPDKFILQQIFSVQETHAYGKDKIKIPISNDISLVRKGFQYSDAVLLPNEKLLYIKQVYKVSKINKQLELLSRIQQQHFEIIQFEQHNINQDEILKMDINEFKQQLQLYYEAYYRNEIPYIMCHNMVLLINQFRGRGVNNGINFLSESNQQQYQQFQNYYEQMINYDNQFYDLYPDKSGNQKVFWQIKDEYQLEVSYNDYISCCMTSYNDSKIALFTKQGNLYIYDRKVDEKEWKLVNYLSTCMCLADKDITIKFVNEKEVLLFGTGKINKGFFYDEKDKQMSGKSIKVLACKVVNIDNEKTVHINYTNSKDEFQPIPPALWLKETQILCFIRKRSDLLKTDLYQEKCPEFIGIYDISTRKAEKIYSTRTKIKIISFEKYYGNFILIKTHHNQRRKTQSIKIINIKNKQPKNLIKDIKLKDMMILDNYNFITGIEKNDNVFYQDNKGCQFQNHFTIDFWEINSRFNKVTKKRSFDLHGLLQFISFKNKTLYFTQLLANTQKPSLSAISLEQELNQEEPNLGKVILEDEYIEKQNFVYFEKQNTFFFAGNYIRGFSGDKSIFSIKVEYLRYLTFMVLKKQVQPIYGRNIMQDVYGFLC